MIACVFSLFASDGDWKETHFSLEKVDGEILQVQKCVPFLRILVGPDTSASPTGDIFDQKAKLRDW